MGALCRISARQQAWHARTQASRDRASADDQSAADVACRSAGGLAPVEAQRAIALARRIQGMGITLVIVEHIAEVIMALTERVVLFNQDRVIAHGRLADVFKTKRLLKPILAAASGKGEAERHGIQASDGSDILNVINVPAVETVFTFFFG